MGPLDLVRAFYEKVWGERRFDLLGEIFDDECITHQLRSGRAPMTAKRGPAELEHHIREWLIALPDATMSCDLYVSGEDLVGSRALLTGTHLGPWYGIPPTGKPLSVEIMAIHRASHGKIVEDWVLVEAYGAFEQLGLVPSREDLLATAAAAAART